MNKSDTYIDPEEYVDTISYKGRLVAALIMLVSAASLVCFCIWYYIH